MNLIERAAKKLEDQEASPLGKKSNIPSATDVLLEPKPSPNAEAKTNQGRSDRPVFQLDIEGLRKKGFITPTGRKTGKLEEYRRIKRPMLRLAFDRDNTQQSHNNLIMVTSAIPGEGKTYSSINLAMSIAQERDVYVLLIDADLNRASATKLLGLADRPGLSDLLGDENIDVGDVLVNTNIDNLSIIPAGAPHDLSTELLSSERAQQITDEISSRYPNRIVVFDTSPILSTSESVSLSQHVGQIAFVVEFSKTTESLLNRALDSIGNFENIGFILNKVTSSVGRGHGEKYGGYYYQNQSEN